MADATKLQYYILFANYTHGLALQALLKQEGIPARIAPTPRHIQGSLSCGMSLLLQEEYIEQARACIARHKAKYHDIVPLPCQIRPDRNRFC